MIEALHLLVLRCKDIEVTKRFYSFLGLIFEKERHGGGPEHYAAMLSDTVFELYPASSEAYEDNSRIGLTVCEDAILPDALSNLGIPIESQHNFHDSIVYVVEDPDGRKVELAVPAHTKG
ncbi:VOC family protein [Endozoicomonas elysicola]|uniref:VOC domain-containing protein n=1 Tax=Endozoicomonas elysicola TaxID=305900 RepID=A0A081KAV4_9GAMM|nr:VOC family protein [Endozoicomonas elysicola]KEI71280.1 hypothetical protein GV64_11485 [Endozoicomonas elysicola]